MQTQDVFSPSTPPHPIITPKMINMHFLPRRIMSRGPTTLHSTSLHYTTLHSITLQLQLQLQLQLDYTTLH